MKINTSTRTEINTLVSDMMRSNNGKNMSSLVDDLNMLVNAEFPVMFYLEVEPQIAGSLYWSITTLRMFVCRNLEELTQVVNDVNRHHLAIIYNYTVSGKTVDVVVEELLSDIRISYDDN